MSSLTTTFGLDFLLLEDKKGGDVDTIHKVEVYQNEKDKGGTDIHISDDLKQKISNNPEYNSGKYHSQKNYKKNNEKISKAHKEGVLKDSYTGKHIAANVDVNLDHIISANEVHNDYRIILSEMDGAELANRDYNLEPTHYSLNKSKNDKKWKILLRVFLKRLIINRKNCLKRIID